MAKYTITHACGHEATHQICGPYRDRPRQEAKLASQDCPDCRRAAREREREQAARAAAEANIQAGAVDLTGSPRQISWAEQIRRPVLQQAAATIAALEPYAESSQEYIHICLAICRGLRLVPEASLWIEARNAWNAPLKIFPTLKPVLLDYLQKKPLAPRAILDRALGLGQGENHGE